MSDFKVGDEVIKISNHTAIYMSSNQPNNTYESQDRMFVVSVGRKWIHLGTYPDSKRTEKWCISEVQPCNYLKSDDVKGKVFKNLDDYRLYIDYLKKLQELTEINFQTLSYEQIKAILSICKERNK